MRWSPAGLLAAIVCAACAPARAPVDQPTTVEPDAVAEPDRPRRDAAPDVSVDPDARVLAPHPSDHLFDDTRVATWSLTLAPADLERLNATAFDKMYVPAMLKVDDEEVGQIAVRYKGQYSLNVFCKKDGKLSCPKVSMKLDFAEYVPAKRYRGLKHVHLHSHNEDPTRLRERLGYRLFRDTGVAVPRAAHANVVVNGVHKGLYGLVEAIDGKFTDDRFPGANNGNLYKDAWPTSVDPAYYEKLQKTNEGQRPPTRIVEAARALAGAAPADLPAVVDRWFDLDHLIRATVVSRGIGHWDDFMSVYCPNATGKCTNHNYYLYEEPARDRIWLLPWDLDKAFSIFMPPDAIGLWNAPPPACANTYVMFFWLRHPACDPVLRALGDATRGAWRERYVAAIDRFLAGPFALETTRGHLDRWGALLAPAVMREPAANVGAWQAAVAALKNDLAVLREKLLTLRAFRPTIPFALGRNARAAFDDLTPFALATGLTAGASEKSTVTRRANTAQPLSGTGDLAMEFELRNPVDAPAGAFAQRAYVRIALAPAPGDLRKLTAVRLKIRASGSRPVRIELGSNGYKAQTGRPLRFGWDLVATDTPQTLSLPATALTQPTNAPPTGDLLADVLAQATVLYVVALPAALDASGLLPPGTSDRGTLSIDDVELVVAP